MLLTLPCHLCGKDTKFLFQQPFTKVLCSTGWSNNPKPTNTRERTSINKSLMSSPCHTLDKPFKLLLSSFHLSLTPPAAKEIIHQISLQKNITDYFVCMSLHYPTATCTVQAPQPGPPTKHSRTFHTVSA